MSLRSFKCNRRDTQLAETSFLRFRVILSSSPSTWNPTLETTRTYLEDNEAELHVYLRKETTDYRTNRYHSLRRARSWNTVFGGFTSAPLSFLCTAGCTLTLEKSKSLVVVRCDILSEACHSVGSAMDQRWTRE